MSVWGGKLGDETPAKFDNPKIIVPGTQVEFFLTDVYTRLALLVPKGSERDFPLEFYVLSADGEAYICRVVPAGLWEKDEFKLYSTTTSINQEEWPKEMH